ncbi:hypothetical protein CCAX7_31990 [Capsulimonas corticalis]|uniref:Uncharacterized protein n=1 Tax=Capsulimonas corticalis TaxID=2219043 RepID=A0A402D488_9BACT|nr:UbiA family prenyltransferase [Capsulimonas corticalis]BDI31148.1 hypothetical protein CCAX7_31990 [Capsulimonas corticalis]
MKQWDNAMQSGRDFLALIRARDWWDSKLTFPLGVAYALAWRLHIPAHNLWSPLLLLMAAGITCAIFASIFNDLLDQREDRLAGKTTGMMRLSPAGQRATLAAVLASMTATAFLLRHNLAALLLYLSMWLLFTAYSLPPVRLKERGVWGALCLAVGEHLLFALLTIVLIAPKGGPAPAVWIGGMSVWAIAFGLRSTLWHQLDDARNDRVTGTATLGARRDPVFLRRLGERIVFPIELCAFGVILVLSGSSIAWILLAFYVALEWLRTRYLAANVTIVAPAVNFRFAMLEYYQFFFPVAYLLEYARVEQGAWVLLAAQLLLFPAPGWLMISHVAHILRWRVLSRIIHRWRRLTHNS